MSTLNAKQRAKISSGKFGIVDKRTGERSYPMPDRAHAGNAKARASQQLAAGNLTPAQKAAIDAKANRILGEQQ